MNERQPTYCIAPLLTHEEVGALMGCSKARVQAIEYEALAKLRRLLERGGYSCAELQVRDNEPRVRVRARRG